MKAASPKLRRSSAYWLLSSRDGVHEVFLTFSGAESGVGLRTLPVFSAERAAGAFVASGAFDEEMWRARKATSGELISILYGPCERIGRVALDPVGLIGFEETGMLQVTLSPVRFVDMLLGRDRHWFEQNHGSATLPVGGPQVASKRAT